MQGILYVSHGSRVPEAVTEATSCISSVKEQVDVALQEVCFLELAQPTIEKSVRNLVKQGASRIAVIPVLLLSAGHYYKDIPSKIDQEKAKYPAITFSYGQPLGVQDRFIDILIERIKETNTPVLPDAKILLVGRGSRSPQTKKDVESIGNKLKKRMNNCTVNVCYLSAYDPSFEQALHDSLNETCSQVFILPYLWFTGVLMRFIEEKINTVEGATTSVILCQQLGNHPVMQQALKERVYESFS